jgi:flagellar motility protein MotE (MotC chaperone)
MGVRLEEEAMKTALKKVLGLLMVLSTLAVVAMAGAIVAGLATGRLTGVQMDAIAGILRGARTTGTGSGEEMNLPREREELNEIRQAKAAQEELLGKARLETERKQEELEGIRRDAMRAVADLDAKLKNAEAAEKKLAMEKAAYEEAKSSEGLRKLKEVLEEMDARNAAQMLYGYDLDTTVRVLLAIRKDERAAIIEAMMAMDRQKGLTETTGRAGQILKVMGKATDGTTG